MTPFTLIARGAFENDVDSFIPEMWAQAGLIQLQAHMVAARLVHRDFENEVRNVGDIVNTRRPSNFTAVRKARGSDITVQDAVAPNVAVPLDQHLHTSFLIHDVDASKSFTDLHREFLVPALRSLAQQIDVTVIGQAWQFYMNAGGAVDAAGSIAAVMETREKLNTNLAPQEMRSFIVNTKTDSKLVQLPVFHEADKSGDTMGLREASLGRKFGFDFYMGQNTPITIDTYQPSINTAFLVNEASGLGAGATAVTVDTGTGEIPPNTWITIAGDDTPQRIVSRTGTTPTTALVVTPGLAKPVANNAIITTYLPTALVNLAAGYAAGYGETIAYDTAGTGKRPQIGQAVIFGTATTAVIYTITQVTGTASGTILLDRPLEAAISNNDPMALTPTIGLNFAFHKHCLSLVIRPLAAPYGAGANTAMASSPEIGAAVRVTAAYDQYKQATVMTIDLLAGIKVLDTDLGAIMCTNDV